VEVLYPTLAFDLERDCFLVWVRWVSMEEPASPEAPPSQGIRVELVLNRNSVLGPSILYRRDLAVPVWLRADRARVGEALRAARRRVVDVQLVIHGSIAHAPYAALYVVREHEGDAIGTSEIAATPLLQLQPSTPADRWHVAAQANLRVRLSLEGGPGRLPVLGQ
jgi:hypothetical protein